MIRIKFKYPNREDDSRVHLPSHDAERTLCGLAFEGECAVEAYPPQEFVATRSKANCELCYRMFEHAKQIKHTDFEEQKSK